MFAPQSDAKSYGVKYQARCLVAQKSEGDESRFLVGTLSLREENEVHVIQYQSGNHDITCEGVYTHQHEIWDLASCPFDPRLFSTVYCSAGEFYAAIWRIPTKTQPARSLVPPQLEQVTHLNGLDAPIKCVLWHPGGQLPQVISCDRDGLRLWNIEEEKHVATVEVQVHAGELQQIGCGRWDPHSVHNVATGSDSGFTCWDLRTMKSTLSTGESHRIQVRDIDFNTREEHLVVTTGDDSRVRLWDLRTLGSPLMELKGHSHWGWRARYNPHYDSLILSSGSDSVVNVWHVPSAVGMKKQAAFSAADFKGGMKAGSPKSPLEDPAQTFTEHEDSVYGIGWSLKDPWMFASISYDGRVMIGSVGQSLRRTVLS